MASTNVLYYLINDELYHESGKQVGETNFAVLMKIWINIFKILLSIYRNNEKLFETSY